MPKSVSQSICHPWGDRETSVIYRSLTTPVPRGKNVFICFGARDRDPLWHVNEEPEETIKVPEVLSEQVSVWVWLFWKPWERCISWYYLCLSLSFSLNVLLCDCYRFNKENQYRIVAFTRIHLPTQLRERKEVKIVSEQDQTHHPLWFKKSRAGWGTG